MNEGQQRWHIPALDGVRGLAFLLVLCVHSGLMRGGRIGVDLFFVLSGFLITSILLAEQKRRGSIHLGYFYARRGLRLFPALFLMVACVVAYIAIWQPDQLAKTITCAEFILAYMFNWLLVWQWPDLSLHQWMFSHVWSLSVEEQFYWLWPIFLTVLAAFNLHRRTILLILIAGLVYPSLARWAFWPGGMALDVYFRTDTRIDGLIYGALIAWLTQNELTPADRYKPIVRWSGVAALACLLWMSQYEMLSNDWAYRGGFTLANLAGAILIASLAWGPHPAVKWIFEVRALRWIGLISYGLYLWHWPIIRLMIDSKLPEPIRTGLIFAIIFAVATLSFYVWERPWLKLKRRFEFPPPLLRSPCEETVADLRA